MSAETHPCIFKNEETKEFIKQADARIQAAWRSKGTEPKFGDMRRVWRERHCQKLNRYSSEDCPFSKTACAMVYEANALQAAEDAKTSPMGWFWARAGFSAGMRQEMGYNRTDGPSRSSLARSAREGLAAGQRGDAGRGDQPKDRVSRSGGGPQRIGELLGPYDPRTRQTPTENGEEGKKR